MLIREMTLHEFRATGRDVADLQTALPTNEFYDSGKPRPGRVYLDNCYIEKSDKPEKPYYLMIDHDEYEGALADLEVALYEWALHNFPDEMQVVTGALEGFEATVDGYERLLPGGEEVLLIRSRVGGDVPIATTDTHVRVCRYNLVSGRAVNGLQEGTVIPVSQLAQWISSQLTR